MVARKFTLFGTWRGPDFRFQFLLRFVIHCNWQAHPGARLSQEIASTRGECMPLLRKFSRPLAALAFAPLLAAAAGSAYAQSSPINVGVDGVQRVSLRGAAASVIVANPQIADVTVVDANTLFITGKGYGVTEVAAVDAIGRTIFQNRVVVTGGQSGSVRLWRGAEATEMACAASCSPSVRTVTPIGGMTATPTP